MGYIGGFILVALTKGKRNKMSDKTKEMLIQEAIVFINKNIQSNFRGELIHKVEFSAAHFTVTLYHKSDVQYIVDLYLDGHAPMVTKKTLKQTWELEAVR